MSCNSIKCSKQINEVQGESGALIKKLLNYPLAKNVSLQNIKTIRDILLNKN